MAVTVQRFQKSFTEFKDTEMQLIQQKLDAAILRTNATTFGDLTDQAVMLLTAHLLAISPEGEKVRLVKTSSETIYSDELNRMRREATIGLGRTT
jgi:hypothetical protein